MLMRKIVCKFGGSSVADAGINSEIVNQNPSQISLLVGVKGYAGDRALHALDGAYF